MPRPPVSRRVLLAAAVAAFVVLPIRGQEGGGSASQRLFDGKTLTNWKSTPFGGEGAVNVEDGQIVLFAGGDMTGVTWAGPALPTTGYELALQAMSEAGLAKLEQPDFTASTRAGSPALLVLSEQAIPEAYWLPQPPKLDRQGLLGELKRGAAIHGAELSNPKPVLMVRIK